MKQDFTIWRNQILQNPRDISPLKFGMSQDEVIEIFGTVNQLEDSGWRVDVVFDSDQKMTFSMGYNISIKGDYIE